MKSVLPVSFAVLLAALLLLLEGNVSHLSAQGPHPDNEPARGMIYDQMEFATTGICAHLYRLVRTGYCTHGPDPVPQNVKITEQRPPINFGGKPYTSVVHCDGDGTSGKRTQVLYVHAANVTDRYNTYLASFQSWVAQVDSIYNDSAAETGGTRSVRFVHDANCVPVIPDVQVSSTGDDNFDNTISELKALGYNRTDRKYMIFVDANVYCGIGTVTGDDQAGSNNQANTGPSYGRSDTACWDAGTAAHEHMHNLGGVQRSAPHSTYRQVPNNSNTWHCSDDYDDMCYADAPGVVMTYPCGDPAHEQRFDCNHDDYYNTNPAAGSYLATHWNVANSQFLFQFESVGVGQIWTTDENDNAKIFFLPGDQVGAHFTGLNQTDGSVSMSPAWEILDSTGTCVPNLCDGTEPFQTMPVGSTEYTHYFDLPADIPMGVYTFVGAGVYQHNGQDTNFQGQVTFQVGAPLVNDDFDAAIPIANNTYSILQDVAQATTAADDPTYLCTPGRGTQSVWFKFVAPSNGSLDVNTIGSGYDTVLEIWTGARGALGSLGCDDDSGGQGTSKLSNVLVSGGETYYVEVAGFSSSAQAGKRKTAAPQSVQGSDVMQLALTFTSGQAQPVTPCLVSPTNGSQNTVRKPTLDWCDASSATYYTIQVRRDKRTGTTMVNTTSPTSSFKTPRLAKGYKYFWRVSACNSVGCSAPSKWWKFIQS